MPSCVCVNGLTNVIKSIPVKSCRETGRRIMVMKFPHGEAKAEVKALVGSSTDFMDVAVTEPKKMLPKMTLLYVPPSLPDGEIISAILEKNPQIKELLNVGHTLTLGFSRVRGRKKMAVIKMSPAVCNVIASSCNRVFLGLSSCGAFDRFWATQCRQCQKFGHTKDRCPAKNTSPCSLCDGPHVSLNCPGKIVLKCVNCSSLGSPAERCLHSASSLDCPVKISERNKVMNRLWFFKKRIALSRRPLRCGLFNIRSIRNKVCSVIESLAEHNLDLLCITETWLLPSDLTIISAALPSSYSFRHVPRSMDVRGEGVSLIYTRALLNVKSCS